MSILHRGSEFGSHWSLSLLVHIENFISITSLFLNIHKIINI